MLDRSTHRQRAKTQPAVQYCTCCTYGHKMCTSESLDLQSPPRFFCSISPLFPQHNPMATTTTRSSAESPNIRILPHHHSTSRFVKVVFLLTQVVYRVSSFRICSWRVRSSSCLQHPLQTQIAMSSSSSTMGHSNPQQSSSSDPVRDLGLPSPIILGSGSFTRKLILGQMNIDYFVHVKPIDEKSIGQRSHGSNPEELVLTLAQAKATNIIRALQEEDKDILSKVQQVDDAPIHGFIILTADQVVTHDNSILEKPESYEQATEFVHKYAIQPPATVGSVVLTHIPSYKQVSGVDISTIHFKPTIATCNLIPRLVQDGAPVLDCAGGLMIEHPLVEEHLERIDGSIDGVMGLSKALVLRLLKEMQQNLNRS